MYTHDIERTMVQDLLNLFIKLSERRTTTREYDISIQRKYKKYGIFPSGRPKVSIGYILVERKYEKFKYNIELIRWRDGVGYYVVIWDEPARTQPRIEIRSYRNTSRDQSLQFVWKYVPKKQDNRNDERKQLFTSLASNYLIDECTVGISLPKNLIEAQTFLNQLTDVLECRLRCDGLIYDATWKRKPRGVGAITSIELDDEDFNSDSLQDARKRTKRLLVQRLGQPQFRDNLLKAYKGRCAATGCQVPQALEAAHIIPYKGEKTNHVSNGLLLRADIHTLWDRTLVAIDPDSEEFRVAEEVRSSPYKTLDGKVARLPSGEETRPNKAALKKHFEEFKKRHHK